MKIEKIENFFELIFEFKYIVFYVLNVSDIFRISSDTDET
jgi:hypothetical protein